MQNNLFSNGKNKIFELQNSLNINSIDYEEIYPNIIVYKNLYSNIEELFDKILFSKKKSKGDFIFEKWKNWFTFGDYSSVINDVSLDVPTGASAEDLDIFRAEHYCLTHISEASQLAIAHYIKHFNLDIPNNSIITKPNIASYSHKNYLINKKEGSLNKETVYKPGDLAMEFHTDYPIDEWYWPGKKFLITCNTYINDDYLGGEVIFIHNDNIIPYKPVAGDVIIFPSGSPLFPSKPKREPYFHGVAIPTGADKYLVRTYILYETDTTLEWEQKRNYFCDENSFNKFLEDEAKEGANAADVFLGDKKINNDDGLYDPGENCNNFNLCEYNLGDEYWIRVDKKVFDLYDISRRDIYFLKRRKT
jgi:hypothetical protein